MGQAKRRGTFEERRAAAIARDQHKPSELPPLLAHTDDGTSQEAARAMTRRPMSPILQAALIGAIMGTGR